MNLINKLRYLKYSWQVRKEALLLHHIIASYGILTHKETGEEIAIEYAQDSVVHFKTLNKKNPTYYEFTTILGDLDEWQ